MMDCPGECEKKTILVYNGLGSDAESSTLLLEALQKSLKPDVYTLRYTSAEEIVRGKLIILL